MSRTIFTFRIFLYMVMTAMVCGVVVNLPALAEYQQHPGEIEVVNLSVHAQILATKKGRLDIKKVVGPVFQKKFEPVSESEIYIQPHTDIWIKIDLNHDHVLHMCDEWLLEVGNYRIETLHVYSHGTAIEKHRAAVSTGFVKEIKTRETPYPFYVYKIRPVQGYVQTFYLYMKSHAKMPVPLKAWDSKAFRIHNQIHFLGLGMIFGILLGMSLFNLFIYFTLKDQLYLVYVTYMLCMLTYLTCLNGYHVFFFNMPPGNNVIPLWVTLGSVIVLAVWFIKSFLNTKKTIPYMHHFLTLVQISGMAILTFGALQLHNLAHHTAVFGGMSVTCGGLAAGIIRLRQQFYPARYFLLAWTALLLGAMTLPLKEIGLLSQHINGELATSIGAALESILLSFALADRIRVLRKEKDALAQSQKRYQKASLTDSLTGLFNIRYLKGMLDNEISRAIRMEQSLSLLMMDLDNFKTLNDTYGHQAGDMVLERFAQILQDCAREKDAPCRYGGEEFVLVLPQTTLDNAVIVAERIRENLSSQDFHVGGDAPVAMTVSIGIAQLAEGDTATSLQKRADDALYRAKRNGKNRVEQG